MKLQSIIFFLFFIFPAVSYSQVASPSLNPSERSLNPAASAFRKMSSISINYFALADVSIKKPKQSLLKTTDQTTTNQDSSIRFNGVFARNNIGIETYYSSINKRYQFAYEGDIFLTTETFEKTLHANFSYSIYEVFSLGIAKGHIDLEDKLTVLSPGKLKSTDFSATFDSLSFGANLRIQGFFIGYSVDQIERNRKNKKSVNYSFANLGGGYSYGSPRDFEFRIEASIRNREQDEKKNTAKIEQKQYHLEIGYHSFFLGLSSKDSSSSKNRFTDSEDGKSRENEKKISIGYKEYAGIYILLEAKQLTQITEHSDDKARTLNFEATSNSVGLSVSYAF